MVKYFQLFSVFWYLLLWISSKKELNKSEWYCEFNQILRLTISDISRSINFWLHLNRKLTISTKLSLLMFGILYFPSIDWIPSERFCEFHPISSWQFLVFHSVLMFEFQLKSKLYRLIVGNTCIWYFCGF